MSNLTRSRFESLLSNLDALTTQLRDDQQFDEADTIDEALVFLGVLRESDILVDDTLIDETPVDVNMETLRTLCLEMKFFQNQALILKTQTAENKIPLDDLRKRKIPDLMQSLGVKTATFTGLGRVQTAADLYASTKAGKKEDAMRWLRDCGYEGMIQETYNSSSLKALFRRLLVDGAAPPEDIFSVIPFVRASIVKA